MNDDDIEEEKYEILPNAYNELSITFHQLLYVISYVVIELIEVRLTYQRYFPPRLLISQFLQYVSMFIASFLTKGTINRRYFGKQKLSSLSSITLTLLDISCDASTKISMIFANVDKIETSMGFFQIFQCLISKICFGTKFNLMESLGIIFQTFGYIMISKSPVGEPYEPIQTQNNMMMGFETTTWGYLFFVVALTLRCMSLTIIESLNTTIEITPQSLCRGNGSYGILITFFYNMYIVLSKKDKIVFLSFLNLFPLILFYLLLNGIKYHNQFWLLLNTTAIENSRVTMLAMIALFYSRHIIFRREGMVYGYSSISTIGAFFTIVGFSFLSMYQKYNNDNYLILDETNDNEEVE